MPGFELFGDAERKQANDVLESGVFMRYGFDGDKSVSWKPKELEPEFQENLGVKYAQLIKYSLTDQILNGLQDLNATRLPQADDFMARNMSCFKLSRTEEQLPERAANMLVTIKSVW